MFKRKKINESLEREKMLHLLSGVPKEKVNLLKQALNSALSDLHGTCSACANYTINHNEGPCRYCCWEKARDKSVEVNDNWVWRYKELYGI